MSEKTRSVGEADRRKEDMVGDGGNVRIVASFVTLEKNGVRVDRVRARCHLALALPRRRREDSERRRVTQISLK